MSDVFKERNQNNWISSLLTTLANDKIYQISDFLKIDEPVFGYILEKLEPKLRKNSIRRPIPPKTMLLVTLHFLAYGTNYHSLR